MSEARLAATLARLSSVEMVEALGLGRAPSWVRRAGEAAFTFASRPLGAVLARFDHAIAERGLAAAAAEVLDRLAPQWRVDAPPPATGPLLVVANHPGAYDALALMAAIGRRDLGILAADRAFLRALPSLGPHLFALPDDDPPARARGMRGALRHLRRGGALLHFGAGRIEPDPAFLRPGEEMLGAWQVGTGALVRACAREGGQVVAALVAGVHSPRAKRLVVVRVAERFGVTTLAPLLQVALPAFRDVEVRVIVGAAVSASEWVKGDDQAIAQRARGALDGLRAALE